MAMKRNKKIGAFQRHKANRSNRSKINLTDEILIEWMQKMKDRWRIDEIKVAYFYHSFGFKHVFLFQMGAEG